MYVPLEYDLWFWAINVAMYLAVVVPTVWSIVRSRKLLTALSFVMTVALAIILPVIWALVWFFWEKPRLLRTGASTA